MNNLKIKLKENFGFSSFKNLQEPIINNLINGNHSLVILPTGGGKSLCYQLPALYLDGIAIVISPLIALMKNQVDLIRGNNSDESIAHVLNSSLTKNQIEEVKSDITNGKTKIVFIAPETLTKKETIAFLSKSSISFLAIDEAHCISEWGHDFRPEYRKIKEIFDQIKPDITIIALTATATPKVQDEIIKNLKIDNGKVYKSSFNRPNLYYEIRSKSNETNLDLIKFINSNKNKSGIIYCLSRKQVEELSELLNINKIKSLPYHAGLDNKIRNENQDKFLKEECDVIVATIAFGMGIDKPDVRFVIHYDIPKSIEGYYQETGRAGRDGGEGICILYYSYDDVERLEKLFSKKNTSDREVSLMLLGEMMAYAESSISRRKFLLNYFGEEYNPGKDNIDVLDDNLRFPKEKTEAKEYLSILLNKVINSKEKFKHKTLIKSIDRKGLKSDERFWNTVLRSAIMDGFLKKEIKNYGSLIITEKGEGYIKDPETYLIPEDRDFDSSPKTDNNINKRSVIDQELMSSLIKLRKKVAQKFSVPPFVVFQEFSLEEMTYKYPINLEELKNINGVGEGKANKFGHDFISLIKGYVNENNIERPDDVKLRTSGAKSASKLSLIQNIDKKIPLDEIINSKGVEFSQLLFELESIVFSGTKLNIDYYINDILDEDQQLDLHDYFIGANNEDVSVALQEFDGEFDEDDIRLYRIKFISDIAN